MCITGCMELMQLAAERVHAVVVGAEPRGGAHGGCGRPRGGLLDVALAAWWGRSLCMLWKCCQLLLSVVARWLLVETVAGVAAEVVVRELVVAGCLASGVMCAVAGGRSRRISPWKRARGCLAVGR